MRKDLREPINSTDGSGEFAGDQVMTGQPEEQTEARQSAGTIPVKSPSASAHGSGSSFAKDALSGVGQPAPTFFGGLTENEVLRLREEIRTAGLGGAAMARWTPEERIQEMRGNFERLLRREHERANWAEGELQKAKRTIEKLHEQVMYLRLLVAIAIVAMSSVVICNLYSWWTR